MLSPGKLQEIRGSINIYIKLCLRWPSLILCLFCKLAKYSVDLHSYLWYSGISAKCSAERMVRCNSTDSSNKYRKN